jgi:hypothetical protein
MCVWLRAEAKRTGVNLVFTEDGVPEGIRTPDPRFRKPVLYPAELPGPYTPRAAFIRYLDKVA